MITNNKKLMLLFAVFSILCVIAIGVCFICDFVINRGVTWSAYVMSSVTFAWVVATPLMISKTGRIIRTLVVLIAAVFPFLAILSSLTPVTGWFAPLALPIGITAVIALLLTYLMFRFIKINLWYLFSGVAFLFGIVVSSLVQYFVGQYVGEGFIDINYLINIFACIVVTVLLAIIGRYSNMSKKSVVQDEQPVEQQDEQ